MMSVFFTGDSLPYIHANSLAISQMLREVTDEEEHTDCNNFGISETPSANSSNCSSYTPSFVTRAIPALKANLSNRSFEGVEVVVVEVDGREADGGELRRIESPDILVGL